MADEIINTFSDADCERIIRSVRKTEGISPLGERRSPRATSFPLWHFENGATPIAAFNETTKQMSYQVCRIWLSNSSGQLIDSGRDMKVFNPGGEFSANKFGVAMFNEAGLLVILVEGCIV